MLENLEQESQLDMLTEKLESLGFETTWMLPNLGSILLFVAIYFVLLIVLLFMKALEYCFPKCMGRKAQSLSSFLLWRWPIRFLRDSFSVIAICCIVNIAYNSWGTTESIVNSSFAAAMLAFLVLYPALMQWFLYRNRDNLEMEEFRSRYGSAYRDLSLEKSKFVV